MILRRCFVLWSVAMAAAVPAPVASAATSHWWPPVEVSPGPVQSDPAVAFFPGGTGAIAFQDASGTTSIAPLRVKGRFPTSTPVTPVVDGTLRQMLLTSGIGTTLLFENPDHSWSAQVKQPSAIDFHPPQQLAPPPESDKPSVTLTATNRGDAVATIMNSAGLPQASVLPRNAGKFKAAVFLDPSVTTPARS